MKYCRKYSLRKPAAVIPILFALVCALAVGGVFFVAFEFMYSAEALSGGRAEVRDESARDRARQAVAPVVEGAGAGGFAGIPAVIEANWGQLGRDVQFVSRGAGYAVEFDAKGLEVAAGGVVGEGESRIGIEFVGAGERAREGAGGIAWKGREELRGRVNYLVGRGADWRADVPLFGSVEAKEIFAGVDCITKVGEEPEFDLTVAPHADVRGIRMRLSGAERVSVDGAGNLILRSRAGEVRLAKPRTYQDGEAGDSVRHMVDARYVLESRNVVGVRVGAYDRDLPLVIDPTISVSYVTFLGGAGSEQAFGVAVGPSGKVYVSGSTTQANFPALSGNAEGVGGGASDFFVAEIDPTKSGAASLVYLTFIGGSGNETGGKLAVNATGEAAVVGLTTSADYPVTDATKRTSGTNDLAISVLGAAGNSFVFSTLLGGSGAEGVNGTPAVAFDPQGNVVVAADTTSTDLGVSAGAYATAYGGGNSDGMLAVYGPAGTLGYLTYLGINAQVAVTGVAEDLLGQAYVAGYTSQPVSGTFATTNGFQVTYGGGPFDGFVVCIAPNGLGTADLKFGSYLGGSAADEPLAIAVDNTIPATVYVTGLTESVNFPSSGSVGAGFQGKLNAPINGFVTAISQTPAGVTSLAYSTYLGGSAQLGDTLLGIVALGPDAVYVAGRANSADFPVLSSLQSFSGTSDAVVAKFDTTQAGAGSVIYASYLGGRNNALANGVAATNGGGVYVAGTSSSPDFLLGGNPQNGAQPVCASCSQTPAMADAFLVAITETATAGPIVKFNANQLNFGNQLVGTPNPPQVAVIENAGTVPLSISGEAIVGVNASDFSISDSQCPASPGAPATLQPTATCSITVAFSPSLGGNESAALSFTDNATGSPQSVNLVGKGLEPLVVFSPPLLSFAGQAEGSTSAQQQVSLNNIGNMPLVITLVTLKGSSAFEFAGLNNCTNPPTLQPGSSCTLSVAFAPAGVGSFAGSVQVSDNQGNDTSSTQTIELSGTGLPPSPTVALSPASINFGLEPTGRQSGPQPVTLSNTGTLPLQISSISVTGNQSADFTLTLGTTCPINGGSVSAGNSCMLDLAFSPTDLGQRTSVLSISDNATGSPHTVALAGIGTSAALTVNSTALAFGPQTLAVAAPAQSTTITNSGGSAIQISGIGISGPNASDFAQANNCPELVNPGTQPCVMQVTFTPKGGGPRSAAIFVADSAPDSPQVIALSGTGLVPALQFGAASPTFGPQLVGMASAAKTVNLQNVGNGGLMISQVGITGANATDFSASNNCGKMLVPRGVCVVQIVFKPIVAGAPTALLQVVDNAPDSPQSVQVSGAATDFEIGAAGGGGLAAAVSAGDTATYDLQVTPEGGFKGQVQLECDGAPAETSCAVNPATVNVNGSAQARFEVTVKTQGAGMAPVLVKMRRDWWGVAALVILVMAWCVGVGVWCLLGRRRVLVEAFGCAAVLGVVLIVAGCGGGGSLSSSGGGPPSSAGTPTPAGSYTLTVTGSSGGVSRKVSLTLAVQRSARLEGGAQRAGFGMTDVCWEEKFSEGARFSLN